MSVPYRTVQYWKPDHTVPTFKTVEASIGCYIVTLDMAKLSVFVKSPWISRFSVCQCRAIRIRGARCDFSIALILALVRFLLWNNWVPETRTLLALTHPPLAIAMKQADTHEPSCSPGIPGGWKPRSLAQTPAQKQLDVRQSITFVPGLCGGPSSPAYTSSRVCDRVRMGRVGRTFRPPSAAFTELKSKKHG